MAAGTTVSRCGDGIWDRCESCDDGNEDDNDGCRTTCETARCGDGVRRTDLSQGQEGYEACDDGNNIPNDGCNNECVVGLCGNGQVDAGEQCDDANQSNTDGCTNNCARHGVVTVAFVRGSKRAEGYEACDDGNKRRRMRAATTAPRALR